MGKCTVTDDIIDELDKVIQMRARSGRHDEGEIEGRGFDGVGCRGRREGGQEGTLLKEEINQDLHEILADHPSQFIAAELSKEEEDRKVLGSGRGGSWKRIRCQKIQECIKEPHDVGGRLVLPVETIGKV